MTSLRKIGSFLLLFAPFCFLNGQEPTFSSDFIAVTNYETCTRLVDSVHKSWKPAHDQYIKSAFTTKQTSTVNISFPCMTTVKRMDAEILFGKPNRAGVDYGLYYTSPPYKDHLVTSFAKISYARSRLSKITEYVCPGTIKFVQRNFKYNVKTKFYRTPLIPKSLGIDTINNVCLQQLKKDEFISVIGKPTLEFRGDLIGAHQRTEWDEKGNEVVHPPADLNVYWLRYTVDTSGKYKNSGFEIKIMPDPASTTIIVYNCANILDTIKKKWSYNSEKKYFKNRLNWIENDLLSKCLYGAKKKDVLALFGEPSTKTESTFEYYLQPFPYANLVSPDKIVILFDKYSLIQTVNHEYALMSYSSH
jgi:hypothetical protein